MVDIFLFTISRWIFTDYNIFWGLCPWGCCLKAHLSPDLKGKRTLKQSRTVCPLEERTDDGCRFSSHDTYRVLLLICQIDSNIALITITVTWVSSSPHKPTVNTPIWVMHYSSVTADMSECWPHLRVVNKKYVKSKREIQKKAITWSNFKVFRLFP